MSEKPPLAWGRILFIAVLSGAISLAVLAVIFSPYQTGQSLGDLADSLMMLAMVVLAYFPLTAIIAFLMSLIMVRVRRVAHTVAAVLVSLPIAAGLAAGLAVVLE